VRSVTLRGSYGTSFRAPLIAEIYGNSNNLYNQNYQNPQAARRSPALPLRTEPRAAAGDRDDVVRGCRLGSAREPALQPHALQHQLQEPGQRYLSDLTILTRAAQFAGTGIILQGTAARDRVLQLLAQGILPVGAFPGGSANNVTLFVDGRNQNLGRTVTTGYDFNVTYRMETDTSGAFTFNGNGTYFTKYRRQSPRRRRSSTT